MFIANQAGRKTQNLKDSELREVLRKIETKRRRAAKNNGKAWNSSKRDSNKKLADKHYKKSHGLTAKNKLKEAREGYLKASDLHPASETHYQQYGSSLYREKSYNASIVVMEIVEDDGKNNMAEKYHYMGLSYYALEDWENAEKYFKKSMDLKDKKWSPSSAFYLGLVQQKLEKFDESKEAFQYVLDNSNNSALDDRAEQYIEYGIKQKALAKKRSHRWFYDGVIGTFYDSNIVLAIDGQANTNTDKEGMRFLLGQKLKYRAIYKEKHELGIRANATMMLSRKTDLGQSDDLEATDPWVFGVDVPWDYRGTLWKRGYTFELAPRYETIMMDLDNTSKQSIINSMVVTFKNKLVINPNWIAVANYELRKDDAQSSTGTITDDASAFKIVADFSSIIVLNKDSQRYLIPHMSYTRNDANGADFGYTRIDMNATMTNALWDKFIWSGRLGYYISNYESVRTDKNYSVMTGIGYALSTHWNFGLNTSYQINDSNTNKYKKFQVMSTFTFSY